MSSFRRYRSRLLVEAKELDHAGTFYNPQSGNKDDFRQGDYLIRAANGKQHIERGESFKRQYEEVGD